MFNALLLLLLLCIFCPQMLNCVVNVDLIYDELTTWPYHLYFVRSCCLSFTSLGIHLTARQGLSINHRSSCLILRLSAFAFYSSQFSLRVLPCHRPQVNDDTHWSGHIAPPKKLRIVFLLNDWKVRLTPEKGTSLVAWSSECWILKNSTVLPPA